MPILAIPVLDNGISSTHTMTRSLIPPTSLAHTHPSNMTFVSNDPSLWPYIDSRVFGGYWIVATGVVVVYDWVLTVGQEIELIWMLQVIMIARLHAMYQGSRTMLLFLVIIFLAVNIACVVLAAIGVKYMVAEETILSGVHMCGYSYEGDVLLLVSMVWMLNTVWEVLALCLSVWIAVKHFRDLRRLGPLTGSTVRDCFRVLIESHVLYFAR
ncbi:hypothetical protein EDD22DRAFT_958968 [Suillus occidentalis]|nr:hypothetical protein EDD22DRAFT_958968 [Suillus occidentalis]